MKEEKLTDHFEIFIVLLEKNNKKSLLVLGLGDWIIGVDIPWDRDTNRWNVEGGQAKNEFSTGHVDFEVPVQLWSADVNYYATDYLSTDYKFKFIPQRQSIPFIIILSHPLI